MVSRKMQSGGTGAKRRSIIYKSYDPISAVENINAMCKEIYIRCFDWIVRKVNESVNSGPDSAANESTGMIGILDIFGFEIFDKNSLEQLCINLANEALQVCMSL
tara:strand:+ start:306 stop:620 length:315 start_codon:yes stop_codon:yes gene_type:complete